MTTPIVTNQNNSAANPLRSKPKQLTFPLNLYQTAVGKKWVMAVTGLMLVGFVFAHMIGNLKLYLGVVTHHGERIYDADVYAEFLRNLLVPIFPETVFLWILRLGLLAAVALHIHSAYSLTRMNINSNDRYESKRDWLAANFASRTMRYSGTIVLFYILFHIADLTLGLIPGYDWHHGEVQANVVGSLSNPIVAGFYIIANVLLTVHIFHGIYSMFRSLGLNNPAFEKMRHGAAVGISGLILLGNVSFPVAVLTGVIDYDPCGNSPEEAISGSYDCVYEDLESSVILNDTEGPMDDTLEERLDDAA